MPIINLSLGAAQINQSVRAGDIAYYIPANILVGGFNVNISTAECVEIGVIREITSSSVVSNIDDGGTIVLVCDIDSNTTEPQAGDFIFFSKNRSVNEASIVGYYSKFKFKNNSREKAELFAVACNVNISS